MMMMMTMMTNHQKQPWLLEHPDVVLWLRLTIGVVSVVNLIWALGRARPSRTSAVCYLCEKPVRTRKRERQVWGFTVCPGCYLVYESLLYYAVVQNNENAKKVLGLAGKKLALFSLPVAVSAGRDWWQRRREEEKEQHHAQEHRR